MPISGRAILSTDISVTKGLFFSSGLTDQNVLTVGQIAFLRCKNTRSDRSDRNKRTDPKQRFDRFGPFPPENNEYADSAATLLGCVQ